MTTREKIINALQDCSIEPIRYTELERLSKLDTFDLIDEVITLLYELREEFDNERITKFQSSI